MDPVDAAAAAVVDAESRGSLQSTPSTHGELGDGATVAVAAAASSDAAPVTDTSVAEAVFSQAVDPHLPPFKVTVEFDTGLKRKLTVPAGAMVEDLMTRLAKETGVPTGARACCSLHGLFSSAMHAVP